MTYEEFIQSKSHSRSIGGFKPLWIPSFLFDFQSYLTQWALETGRAANFSDCGLGKTVMELVWGQNVVQHTNRSVLLLTPLSVSAQTMRESAKFAIEATRSRDGKLPNSPMIVITNYERLHYFDPKDFAGVIADESSCIKNFQGERRAELTEFMKTIPYRLLATATAAPNDFTELGTSSEALGMLGHVDMLNRFFKNDNNTSDTKMLRRKPISQGGPITAGWRFKGHAEQSFWRFICSWARACRKPSDLGFEDGEFVLPKLIENEHIVEARQLREGELFATVATNNREEREERHRTMQERCEKAHDLAVANDGPTVIWGHLNQECDILEKMIKDSSQISGSMDDDEKEEVFEAFASGQLLKLIIKDKIGAFGLNWQHCAHAIRFATHSFESDYQAVRRHLRFGQKHDVVIDRIYSEGEAGIKENMQRKAMQATQMFSNLVAEMNNELRIQTAENFPLKMESAPWM